MGHGYRGGYRCADIGNGTQRGQGDTQNDLFRDGLVVTCHVNVELFGPEGQSVFSGFDYSIIVLRTQSHVGHDRVIDLDRLRVWLGHTGTFLS